MGCGNNVHSMLLPVLLHFHTEGGVGWRHNVHATLMPVLLHFHTESWVGWGGVGWGSNG